MIDSIGGGQSSAAMSMDRQTFGAQVVSKTLDYMNQNQSGQGGTNADYDFQTKVLSAAYAGKGTMVDSLI